ncbi:MAG: hypothetical protein KatS3mg042_1401 [Rhodothermaceae bacterium]|nr:MAG: hypothetical protein KatS3mg042_1401 [Rhodothermaceae bacterium]
MLVPYVPWHGLHRLCVEGGPAHHHAAGKQACERCRHYGTAPNGHAAHAPDDGIPTTITGTFCHREPDGRTPSGPQFCGCDHHGTAPAFSLAAGVDKYVSAPPPALPVPRLATPAPALSSPAYIERRASDVFHPPRHL